MPHPASSGEGSSISSSGSSIETLSVLQLPTDFPKTPTTPYQAGTEFLCLPKNLIAALYDKAEQDSIDVASWVLAAFSALLYRYTQQATITVAVVSQQSETEKTIAPLTAVLEGTLSSRELIHQISTSLELFHHAHQPRSPQVQDEGVSSQLPVAVTFLASHHTLEDVALDITEQQQAKATGGEEPDLHLVLSLHQQALAGLLIYNTNLFTAETIRRFSHHLRTLLAGLVENLDTPVAQLPLLTPAELHQFLVEWQSEPVLYPQVPLYHHIETHAVYRPDAIAVTFNGLALTYAELNHRANQFAHYLLSVGVGKEIRVAVCVQPCLEIAICLLGILKAGGVYVPLDPSHPPERLMMILEDTQAKVVLTQTSLLSKLPNTADGAVVEHILCVDRDWHLLDSYPTPNPQQAIALDQTAYIIYTSGTTGKPKGVMASHSNLINYLLATQDRLGFNHEDVMPSVARFSFSISLFELLSPLVAGGTLVVLEREHVLDFQRMAQTLEKLTMLHTVPSVMQRLLTYIQDKGIDPQRYQGVRHVFTGGDIVNPDLLEQMKAVFSNARVYVLYGCSEISSLCSSYLVPRGQKLTKSSIGKPFNNVSVRLYDPDQNLVPIGVPGELYVGGAGVTKGYLHRDDLTQEKFVLIDGQLFYRTGDLAKFRSDGNLEFLGRSDFQINLRGIRIELSEIEATLRQAPGVREGVVMACELGNGEPALVAYLVLTHADHSASDHSVLENTVIAETRHFLQDKLPDYMVPAAFVILEALPLNPNQKVDRRALPQPTPDNMAGLAEYVPPQDEWQQKLTLIWQELLGVPSIGIRNNFFELGGNSLLAVQMLTQVEQVFGKNLPITTLLQAPTIEALAEVIQTTSEGLKVGDLVPLRTTGTKPPLFCIYGLLLYRELANHLDTEHPIYGVYLREEVELLKTGKIDQYKSVFSDVPSVAARYLEVIRHFQPHGPYYIAGESFGGVVAFEMAQQLRAVGEEVALVALFDSWLPSQDTRKPLLQRLQLHGRMLAKYRMAYVQKKGRPLKQKITRLLSKSIDKFQTRSAQVPHPAQPAPSTDAAAPQNDVRQEARLQITESYVAQPYPGRVVLFRAMERDPFEAELSRDMGWATVVQEDLQVFDVPGDHIGILKEPHVQILAQQLRSCLID